MIVICIVGSLWIWQMRNLHIINNKHEIHCDVLLVLALLLPVMLVLT